MTELPIRPHLLTVRQVSVIIGVHTNTVLNYIASGKLKGHNPNGDKKGLRVTEASVRDYLRAYLLDSFDEKIFEADVDSAVHASAKTAHPRQKSTGWVSRW